MSIREDNVEKIAKLARLTLSPEELAAFTNDLNNILGLVDQMTSITTDDVSPLAHPHDALQPLRKDLVTESNERDQFQALAPQTESGLYLVPKIIE